MDNFFSTNLKFLREQHNLSQEQLAEKIDEKTHQTTIGRWEKGLREPTMGNVVRIAEYFNVGMANLIAQDLRLKDYKITNNINYGILKKALIEKGFMSENDDLSEEQFNKLVEIYNANKKFILGEK